MLQIVIFLAILMVFFAAGWFDCYFVMHRRNTKTRITSASHNNAIVAKRGHAHTAPVEQGIICKPVDFLIDRPKLEKKMKCCFSTTISEELSCDINGDFDDWGFPINECPQRPCARYKELRQEIIDDRRVSAQQPQLEMDYGGEL